MILEKLKEIITEQLGVAGDDITEEMDFIEDIGCDSLDLIELVMAVEEEFDIEIPDDEAYKIATVSDAVEYIKTKV